MDGLRLIGIAASDDEALEEWDRSRFRFLMQQEKQRIIRANQAGWVDLDAYYTKTQKKGILWDRSMGRCEYCQKEMNPFTDFTLDHVVARSMGGTDDLENLRACCRTCNARKGNKALHAWRKNRK